MALLPLLATICTHAAVHVGPSATLGPVEVVRQSGVVNCGPAFPPPHEPGQHGDLDIPDAPSRAWVVPGPPDASTDQSQNMSVTLLATHTQARYDIGSSLDDLHHDCRVVFNSSWNAEPSQFNDRIWLMSPYVSEPGASTIYALAHMEFHGWSDVTNHSLCVDPTTTQPFVKDPEPNLCWYNAVVLLVSNDSGRTFQHARAPPNHLVATVPYRYNKSAAPGVGYGDMSNIIIRREDGYLYVFTHSRNDYGEMKRGVCLMRTRPEDLGDPTSWRGWGGGGSFNVTFVNPYNTSVDGHTDDGDAASHVCVPLQSMSLMPHFIGYSTYYARYIAVGSTVQKGRVGMGFALSDNLIEWDSLTVLRWNNESAGVKEAYASILDLESWNATPGANLDAVGKDSGFLYYMHSYRCNLTSFNCLDIWRQRVSFAGANNSNNNLD